MPDSLQKQGLTLYQSVILASIIENETGRDEAATANQKQNWRQSGA